jgi:hypothetical protein
MFKAAVGSLVLNDVVVREEAHVRSPRAVHHVLETSADRLFLQFGGLGTEPRYPAHGIAARKGKNSSFFVVWTDKLSCDTISPVGGNGDRNGD